MKNNLLLFFALIYSINSFASDQLLFNFETGTQQLGIYEFGAKYNNPSSASFLISLAPDVNPQTIGLNGTSTALKMVVNNSSWQSNFPVFTLNTPITITQENRYLHILVRSSNPAGTNVTVLNLTYIPDNVYKGTVRFDQGTVLSNEWFDVVVDLNNLLTNNIQLSRFFINPFIVSKSWGTGVAGVYYFDEIVLNNDPSPRLGTVTGNAMSVNINKKYQTMKGFGASDAWWPSVVGSSWTVDERNKIAQLIFSKNYDQNGNPLGIGMSFWRMDLGSGSYDQGDNSQIPTEIHRTESFLDPMGSGEYN